MIVKTYCETDESSAALPGTPSSPERIYLHKYKVNFLLQSSLLRTSPSWSVVTPGSILLFNPSRTLLAILHALLMPATSAWVTFVKIFVTTDKNICTHLRPDDGFGGQRVGVEAAALQADVVWPGDVLGYVVVGVALGRTLLELYSLICN